MSFMDHGCVLSVFKSTMLKDDIQMKNNVGNRMCDHEEQTSWESELKWESYGVLKLKCNSWNMF